MYYQIAQFKLYPNESKLVSPDGEDSIRPKTLQLLLLLIEKNEQVHNKQALLDAVWDSAGAQEYLLFQSINEIRKLFKPLTVVKTFPRKGYQWIHDFEQVSENPSSDNVDIVSQQVNEKTLEQVAQQNAVFSNEIASKPKKLIKVISLTITVLLVLIVTVYLAKNDSQPSPVKVANSQDSEQTINIDDHQIKPPSRELVVLPIDNKVADAQHDWVRLGAMDVLIQKLKSQRKFAVLDVEDVMMALARGQGFELTDIEQQSRRLRSQLGEIVTLHTKLIGGAMNYQLQYHLIGRYQIKQGIVFADQLEQAWDKLLIEVMEHYQTPFDKSVSDLANQVADYQFLQAMEQFHRGKHRMASQYFMVLLTTQPNNLPARRYLIKSLIYSKQFEQAQLEGERALELALANNQPREHLRLVFELGVLATQQQEFAKANQYFEQSRTLAKQHRDNLYAAFSHTEIGHLLAKQQQFPQANIMYQQALTYHQGFNCPYGQIQNLDALSKTAFAQNDIPLASQYFDDAMAVANKNDLVFEHIWLMLNKVSRVEENEQKHQLLSQSEALLKQIENSEIKANYNRHIQQLKQQIAASKS